MLNQVVLVGRITGEPELNETESGKNVSNITLAVPRSFKNAEGEYDTDFLNVELWNSIAQSTTEYCKKGDLIGVKGRLQMDQYEDKDGNSKIKVKVVAEKVTFLSSTKEKNHDENER